jgi:hypothetical protein
MFFYQVIHIHKVHVWLGTSILVDVASMDLVLTDYGGYGPMYHHPICCNRHMIWCHNLKVSLWLHLGFKTHVTSGVAS